MNYLEHSAIGNPEKIEELKENCVYVMENLNFLPDEHSYVEPFIEPKEETQGTDAPGTADDKANEEDSKKQAPAKDPKKMTAAEKKRLAEEESKRKAEEDSKAMEASAESQMLKA